MRRLAPLPALVLVLASCGGGTHHNEAAPTGSVPSTAASAPATTPAPAAPRPARRRRRKPVHAKPPRHASRSHRTRTRTSTRTSTSGRPRSHTQPAPATPKATITYAVGLALHAGGRAELQACGGQHHFRTYPSGTRVKFSGTVRPIPSGTWKVKLQIKVCRGGSYVDFLKLDASRDKHQGTFGGTFSAPAPGDYEARAELYLSDVQTARSDKSHFATL